MAGVEKLSVKNPPSLFLSRGDGRDFHRAGSEKWIRKGNHHETAMGQN
jgi:hypothetical protein